MMAAMSRAGRGWLMVLLGAAGCGSPQGTPAPGSEAAAAPAAVAPSAAPAAPALQVAPAQFRQLRWLEGRWRGVEPSGRPFFEEYRFENDSTIRSYTYADSASRAPSDSGAIQLRAGRVTTGTGATRWVVTGLGAGRVHFDPQQGARNSFTWERQSADAWRAVLRWPATADRPARGVVYDMRRLSP